MSTITRTQAETLAYAFHFFNDRLFRGDLPDCMVVLHRKNGARGYHRLRRLQRPAAKTPMRPSSTKLRSIPMPSQTARTARSSARLVHEMCHLWQSAHGKDYKKGAHNKEWVRKMEAIGLIPSATGEPGGKQTGRNVTHYIEIGGPFDVACDELLRYVHFQYQSQPRAPKAPRQTVQRIKLACPFCPDVEVRAVEGTKVRCGNCDEMLERVE